MTGSRKSKYRAVPTVVNGIKFSSKAEARRWQDLLLLVRAGLITHVARQQALELAPSVRIPGEKRARPAIRYICDFAYMDLRTNTWVWEDVKGFETRVFRLKQHLVKHLHGIDVRVVP